MLGKYAFMRFSKSQNFADILFVSTPKVSEGILPCQNFPVYVVSPFGKFPFLTWSIFPQVFSCLNSFLGFDSCLH